MSGFDANALLREATERLQNSDFQGALVQADSALALDGGLAEGWMLRGVALSGLGRKGEASESFQKALSLDPQSAKIRYNFAVHLHRAGELDSATRLLEEILQTEPTHEQARALLSTIRAAASSEQSGFGYAPPQQQSAYRMAPPPDEPPPSAHAVRFVENMGPGWTALGVVLMVLSLAVFVYVLAVFGPKMVEQLQLAMRDPEAFRKAQEAGQIQQTGGLGLTVFSWAVRLGLFAWMAVDIADRRGSWFWLAPFVLLCCCGLEALAALLYLGFGRKKAA